MAVFVDPAQERVTIIGGCCQDNAVGKRYFLSGSVGDGSSTGSHTTAGTVIRKRNIRGILGYLQVNVTERQSACLPATTAFNICFQRNICIRIQCNRAVGTICVGVGNGNISHITYVTTQTARIVKVAEGVCKR